MLCCLLEFFGTQTWNLNFDFFESVEYLGVRLRRHRGYGGEAVKARLTWRKAFVSAARGAQGAGPRSDPHTTCDSRVPQEHEPVKLCARGLGCQGKDSLCPFKELFWKIILQWKDISCAFFCLKLGSIFFFRWHVYFLIFLHLSKVLHFNLLEWHLIKINPAICLCWQLRDFLSALSFVGRKEKAVTEEAGRAVGGVSAFIRSGWWKWSCFIWERTSWIALVFCTSQELSWAGYSLAIHGAFGTALQWWEKLSLDWVTVSPQHQFNVAWEILSS